VESLATQMLIGLYLATNGLRVLSYVPQLVQVYKDKTGAQAISLGTWSFWTFSNLTTAAYALAVLQDPFLLIVFVGNTACCGLLVAMVLAKRRSRAATCASTARIAGSGAAS
jgi:hypothetical protein